MSSLKDSRAQAALQKATAAFRRGQLDEAARGLRQVLKHDPAHAQAMRMMGIVAQHRQQPAEAIQWLTQAVERAPDAETCLRLGTLVAAQGDWISAEACFAASCAMQADVAAAQYNRGVALEALDRLPEAIDAFERAIALDGHDLAAFLALGMAYRRLGAHDAALVAFDCAAGVSPGDVRPGLERARTLMAMARFADMLATLDPLCTVPPGDPEVQNLRGIALRQIGRVDEALSAYDLALQTRPDAIEPLNNRGNLLLLNRRFSAALADFDRALASDPRLDWLPGLRLYTAMHLYDWTDLPARRAALLADVALDRRSVQPLALQGMVDDPGAHLHAARIWARSVGAERPQRAPSAAPRADGKIRIAYVSRDFRSHPVSFLIAEVIERHDRDRFEIIAINHGAVRQDEMQTRLRASFDAFVDVAHLPDLAIADLCRTLTVDIAIDLTGLTDGARGGIFAWRAAPVQMLYLGFLGSSGSAVYDYVIADPVLIPPETRGAFDESILYLPSYQANDRRRPSPRLQAPRAGTGLPDGAFVYCCFNNPAKINPEMLDTWAAILHRVPGAVLWVLDEDEQASTNLRRHAQERGVAAERIVLASRTDRDTYLARLPAADLFLDTLPYNAGATASDALWMGLPVLTQIGRSFPARVAASVLRAAGLPELIAADKDAYIAIAVRLAERPDDLVRLRQRLRDTRHTSELFDAARFTRHLERGYAQALQRHLAGEAPADLHILDASS